MIVERNTKNRIPWNKGLSKETDNRVRTYSEKKKGIKSGRIPKTAFKKGQKSWNTGLKGVCKAWNKGLTKATDERVAKYSKRLSVLQKGKMSHVKGKHWKLSEETKNRMAGNQNAKGQKMSSEGRVRWLQKMRGKTSPRKGIILTQETKDKISKNRTGKKATEEQREHYRIASLKKWENPEYRKKVLTVHLPNKAEKYLQEILKKASLDVFEYVGDGKVRIGRKIPDFLDKEHNKIIELFGEHFHKKKDEAERRWYFENYGYDTLIVWAKDLYKNKDNMLNKIKEFSKA